MANPAGPQEARLPARRPVERLGVAVVRELVELIVTGEFAESELLPPEGPLSEHFGVSRTVIRESVPTGPGVTSTWRNA